MVLVVTVFLLLVSWPLALPFGTKGVSRIGPYLALYPVSPARPANHHNHHQSHRDTQSYHDYHLSIECAYGREECKSSRNIFSPCETQFTCTCDLKGAFNGDAFGRLGCSHLHSVLSVILNQRSHRKSSPVTCLEHVLQVVCSTCAPQLKGVLCDQPGTICFFNFNFH